MSADFIFAIAPLPREETHSEIAERIHSIPFDELLNRFEGSGTWLPEDRTEGDLDSWMRARLEDAWHYVNSDARDFGWWDDGNGHWFVLTGGMSWGDDPTDAFDHIRLLENSGITDDGLWE